MPSRKPSPVRSLVRAGLNVKRQWQLYHALKTRHGTSARAFRPHRLAFFTQLLRKQIPPEIHFVFDAMQADFERPPHLSNPDEILGKLKRTLMSRGASADDLGVRLRFMLAHFDRVLANLSVLEQKARTQKKRLMAKGKIFPQAKDTYRFFVADLQDQVETRKRLLELLLRRLPAEE